MAIPAKVINEAIDVVSEDLKTVKLKPNQKSDEFTICAEGEIISSDGTPVQYAVSIIISASRELTDDFVLDYRAWQISKGLSITDIVRE